MTAFEKAAHTLEYHKILQTASELTHLPAAKQAILSLLPSASESTVRRLQKETTEAKRLLSQKGAPSFGSYRDADAILDRAQKGAVLSIPELLTVGQLLAAVRACRQYARNLTEDSVLFEPFSRLIPLASLEESIRAGFTPEGTVTDEASAALGNIRRKIRNLNNRVRESLQHFITSPRYAKALQDNIITTRNSRYVLAVRAESRGEIKGLVHDTSASGSTLFIEPSAVVELNNEIKVAETEERHEIDRILAELSERCREKADELSLNDETVTSLAVIFARAALSEKMDAAEPNLVTRGGTELRRARHPLIDPAKVVPINIALGAAYDTLVITGPNTGGKTVCLKTLGLLHLMAQTGFHIPCDADSTVRIFDDVLADIGDEQSIEQSLSTFSSHMVNIIGMLGRIGENTLVLFDELGAGTDPVEGAALAVSLLEHVRSRGALCAATTHYPEIKAYALNTPRVENGSCEFNVETLSPTYRLIIGTPGRSNAFLICEKLGLDAAIIRAAREQISRDNRRFEDVVEKLEQRRIQAERQAAETERLAQQIRQTHETSAAERERLLSGARQELERAQAEARRLIRSAKASADYVYAQLERLQKEKDKENFREQFEKTRAALREQLKSAEKEAEIDTEPEEQHGEPAPELKPGDRVVLANLSKEGVVDKLDGETVTVRLDRMTVKVKRNTLRLLPRGAKTQKKPAVSSSGVTPRPSVSPEIDLRGLTGDDAWFLVDRYLDEAKLAGLNLVTLIHGKGTGALRAALWRFLKTDSRVKSYRAGAYGEGDYGVTVVEFK